MSEATDFPVKWIEANMPGAPVLLAQPGGLISVLDAFLLHGWGAIGAQRVTVADGVATVICDAGTAPVQHAVIEVSGADDADLNGQARVLSSQSTRFTFATGAAAGTKTGTITIKCAAAGWEKIFSGENKAVYKSTSLQSNGFCWRVDDSQASYATVHGYVSMSDVDTGVGQFPAQGANCFLIKDAYDTKSSHKYVLAADERALVAFIVMDINPVAASKGAFGLWGDAIALCTGGDKLSSYAAGMPAATAYGTGSVNNSTTYFAADRGGTQAASNVAIILMCNTLGAASQLGRMVFSPYIVIDRNDNSLARGILPGLYGAPLTGTAAVVPPHSIQQATIGASEHVLYALPNQSLTSFYGHASEVCFLDITGPWR